MSGAGKSTASACLSDLGFYVIDNFPVPLFNHFVAHSLTSPDKFLRTALLVDIDSQEKQREMISLIKDLGPQAKQLQIIFLDCRSDTILKRYHETRRPHPNFNPHEDDTLLDTIKRERARLMPLQEMAAVRIDTSDMTVHDLRREIKGFVDSLSRHPHKTMRVNFLSFGFKYGIPPDCDLVADVRFLPNPYFVETLRDKNGLDPDVRDFVLKLEDATTFLKYYSQLLEFLLPRYIFEGKSYLNIGIGCTGGKHRSVAIAQALCKHFENGSSLLSVKHRDIHK